MADVFGSIGNEQVELNNAATEATLRLLLQSSLAANKQSIDSINKIALRAGVDENTVRQTNQRISAFGQAAHNTGVAWGVLTGVSETLRKGLTEVTAITEKLTSGAAEASDVFGMISRIGGPIGLVADGLGKLAQFQEGQLKNYQILTQAGVNFGGSLTDLRLAASNTYMTMDQFTGLMKRNSETFAKMGGSANDGAEAFVKISNNLQKSGFGDRLRELGYSSEEANQGIMDYISVTGGRTKAELQNVNAVQKITEGSAQYMEQLDGLARLTGQSREALAAKMKEDAANQAWQGYLLTLDEEGKKKAEAARLEAETRGGKGAAQALQARLMGLPPMTEASQKFVGMMQNGNRAIGDLASNVTDTTKTIDDVKKSGAGLSYELANDSRTLGKTADALIMTGKAGDSLALAKKAENDATRNGIRSREEQIAYEKKVADETKILKGSEADAAAKTQKSINELGQAIMNKLMPAVATFLSYFNPMIQSVIAFATKIINIPGALELITGVVGGLVGVMTVLKGAQAYQAARLLAAGGGRPLGAPGGVPMNVNVVGGGAGGLGGGPGGGAGGGPRGGRGGGILKGLKSLKGGIGGVVAGLALGYASDKLKESGNEKAGAGVDVAGAALSGASTGAMLGSFVPGIGNLVGGIAGGLAGSAYGLYQNWGTLFGGSGKEVPKPEAMKAAIELPAVTEQAKSFVAQTPGTISPFESIAKQLDKLNVQTTEMVKYLKETSEQIRRNVDATKSLSGNLFPTP